MIDFRTFDFTPLKTEEIVRLIFSSGVLKKGEVATLQWRLDRDETLYERLVQDLGFAKFLTGRLAVPMGACTLDESELQLLKFAQKINKTNLKLPELRALIKSFDTMEVVAPSGLKFGVSKKQMLKTLLNKMAKNWAFEVELTDFVQKKGYFYLVPDAGYLTRCFDGMAGAICFDDNSIRIRANQVDKNFDVFCHELRHSLFNNVSDEYFSYNERDPLQDMITEAEAYATSFFVEKGWDVFQKMKKRTLLKAKNKMRGHSCLEIYQQAGKELKKAYIRLFLADNTGNAFDDMMTNMGIRKVSPYEKKDICTYIKKIKRVTIQSSYYIDDFSLKVPHSEFLACANRYLKDQYGEGLDLSYKTVQNWAGIFKKRQKQLMQHVQKERE